MAETWAERKARGYDRPFRAGYDLTCAACAKPMYRGPGSLPQGVARCHECRRAMRQPTSREQYGSPCSDCGKLSFGERCRPCENARRRAGAKWSGDALESKRALRERRNERMRQAPGLNATARANLKAKWLAQGRACAYCDQLATQVDHVIPLALGGTNHEGNLAPCCAACNRAKSDSLLIEWRNGKRARHMRWTPAPTGPRKTRTPKVAVFAEPRPLTICPICNALHAGRRYCSPECSTEYNRRLQRDLYRARVGLPVDPSMPTKKWAA